MLAGLLCLESVTFSELLQNTAKYDCHFKETRQEGKFIKLFMLFVML